MSYKLNGQTTEGKIHSDLCPRERIKLILEEYIAHPLSLEGFKYYKSQSKFRRDIGPFRQEITISKDKWNRGNETCAFWLILFVYAKDYKKWHTLNYNKLPMNDIVFAEYHYHIATWTSKFGKGKYDLSVQNNLEVIEEIILNLKQIAIPLLDNYSDYERAADLLLLSESYGFISKIFDFYTIIGEPKKAKGSLQKAKSYLIKQTNCSHLLLEIEEREKH
ncbi:MAG: hypothetical protein JNK27_08760 [Chitinophagaceae bacterium]|nr:hypothetical protein [Chitinophagaceae bacterium]